MAREWALRVVVAGVGLVVGLALGGLGPRAENRLLRARIDALEEMPRSGRFTEGLSEMLRGARTEAPVAPAPGGAKVPPPPPDEAPPPADTGSGGPEVIVVDGDDDDDEPPLTNDERVDAAKEAMELRNRQAWRALREQADPTPEQEARIQAAVDDMNAQLTVVAEEFAAVSVGGRPPERRDAMVFAADTLETMIATEDAIYDTLGDDVASELDDQVLDPTSYIDASVIEALRDVEGFE